MKTIVVIGALWLAQAGISGCTAETVPVDWKTDCVGRMQISLPGEIDVASISYESWMLARKHPSAGGTVPHKFTDGQEAGWSSVDYFGSANVTHRFSDNELESVRKEILLGREKIRKYARGEANEADRVLHLQPRKHKYKDLSLTPQDGYGWEIDRGTVGSFFQDNHLFDWVVSTDPEYDSYRESHLQTLISGLRPRHHFDVPKQPGVCLPYFFIKDDGKTVRHIGMTYRLKAHPDITVWLEDASAATIGPHQNPNTFTAKGKANFFWAQRYQTHRGIKSLWSFNQTFKDTTLAGQKGVKTFVELTREDKEQTKDYGYLVAVRGDPDAKEDTPDLMLYVIQDSINATKRGIKPLSKDEFLDMAETIAASVKRRETNSR